MPSIVIDQEKCLKCYNCVKACPQLLFKMDVAKQFPVISSEKFCVGCGHCIAVCPSAAVNNNFVPEGIVESFTEKHSVKDPIQEVIRNRRSIRAFNEKKIEETDLQKIIEAAGYAPTAHNSGAIEIVGVRKPEALKKISFFTAEFIGRTINQLSNPFIRPFMLLNAKDEISALISVFEDADRIVSEFNHGNDMILFNADTVLFFHEKAATLFPDANVYCAAQNASLAAHSLGLGSFFAGWVTAACVHSRKIPSIIEIPKRNKVYAVLALGYPSVVYRKHINRKLKSVKWI